PAIQPDLGSTPLPPPSAGRHPSSHRSQPVRGCLRSAKAPLGVRPCRQRRRPAYGRSPGNPARSCPSVHLLLEPPRASLIPTVGSHGRRWGKLVTLIACAL